MDGSSNTVSNKGKQGIECCSSTTDKHVVVGDIKRPTVAEGEGAHITFATVETKSHAAGVDCDGACAGDFSEGGNGGGIGSEGFLLSEAAGEIGCRGGKS